MDAHTARCLQLSTSINPPFNGNAGPYRHNRFDSMNRSRYNPQMPPRMPQRANSMPAVARYPQQPTVNPAAFKQNFQNPMMGGYPAHASHQPSPSNASSYDGSTLFSANTISPNTPFGSEAHWDPTLAIDMKQMQKPHDGFGMGFFDADADFASPFGMPSGGEPLDLIHLNEQDHQLGDAQNPMSPDRRSLSSNSSNDNVGELPDLSGNPAGGLLSQDIPMATVEEEDGVGDFRAGARHSRSNSRAPAPRASSTRRFRRAPYSFDGHRRSSSVMSTASSVNSMPLSMPPTQCCSPVNECGDDFGLTDFSQLDFGSARPSVTEDLFAMDPMHGMGGAPFHSDLIAPQPKYVADPSLFMPQAFEDDLFNHAFPTAPTLPSHVPVEHGLPGSKVDEFAEYAEEPDLFGALSEEASVPSEEDMNPEDESMKPQEQETRFEGDLYTPRFVRGTGVNREGYCGLCKPGRWLVLKNSAYWYDKSFTHGISAATGQPFDGPKETRRMSGNPDVWEGLCGCCNEWIALISNKKKGTTWFRHAYKCHSHGKNKDKDGKKKGTKGKKEASPPIEAPAVPVDAQGPMQHLPQHSMPHHNLHTLGAFF